MGTNFRLDKPQSGVEVKRLLVDLLFMSGGKGGMETYVRELYAEIKTFLPDIELIGVASQGFVESHSTEWFPGEIVTLRTSVSSRAQLAFAEAFLLTRVARAHNVDLIHSPANFGSWSKQIPSLLTLHDVLSFSRPELVPGIHGRVVRALIRKSARSSEHILTVSEASAREIEKFVGVQPNRITVVPLSAPVSQLRPLPRSSNLLLSVGNNLPHKNFSTLLASMSLIPEEERPQLRIVGGNADPLAREIEDLKLTDWVRHLGWVTDSELDELYAKATAVVLPTQFEGFGLPVLEAMNRGCPVLCSDIPVLREVAGNAAVYFEVNNADALSRAIQDILNSPTELQMRHEFGLERSREFTWRRTAETTANVIRALIGG